MESLKIEINEKQPLNEILEHLERLGYVKDCTLNDCFNYVYTFDDGSYVLYHGNHGDDPLITLKELLEM